MIAYTLKNVLELVPEAIPFVKQASLDKDYPLDNKDACMASALCIAYHEKVDGKSVDPWMIEKVANAIDIYGVRDQYNELKDKMSKRSLMTKVAAAEDHEAQYLAKQASFEGDRAGYVDIEQLAKQASDLYEEAQRFGLTPSDSVNMYSCNAFLSKEAAVGALNARFHATQDPVFVKLAVAITSSPDNISHKTIKDLCETVTGLDKKANLQVMGFDFYKEALIVKSAAYKSSLMVKVGNASHPLQKILGIPEHHLNNYLGKEITAELHGDPNTAKAVVESLPADMQQILSTLLRHA